MDIKCKNPITGEFEKIVLDNMIKIKTDSSEVIPDDTVTVYDLPNKNLQVLADGELVKFTNAYTDEDMEKVRSLPTSEIDDTTESLTKTYSSSKIEELVASKQSETRIVTDADNSVIPAFELANNTEYRFMLELESIEFTLPENTIDDYISSIVFKSGATATTIIYPDTIKWMGEDISSDKFVPASGKTYEVLIYWNGFNYCGIVKGW